MTTIFLTVAQFFVFMGFGIMLLVGIFQIILAFLPEEKQVC